MVYCSVSILVLWEGKRGGGREGEEGGGREKREGREERRGKRGKGEDSKVLINAHEYTRIVN